jgi:hypothetical protein
VTVGKAGKSRLKRVMTVASAIAGFYLIGSVPTQLMHTPVWGIVLAVGAMVLVGARSPGAIAGALRGAGLGALTGASAVGTLFRIWPQVPNVPVLLAVYVGATAAACAGTGGLFGYLAARRQRHMEEQWL